MTNTHWTRAIHHDGSALYVSNPTPKLGEVVQVYLRTPKNAPIERIFLRTAPDGENHLEEMKHHSTHPNHEIWVGNFPVTMPRNPYRFLIVSPTDGFYYYNALGASHVNAPEWFDFKLLADFAAPSWLPTSVFYQIFPDRFHNGDPSLTPKPGEWSKREFQVTIQAWGESPKPYSETGNLNFFGGDLVGIQQKLDYLESLGVTAIYLTPIFTSNSNHRYNIHDFYEIDPHLGGEQGLINLTTAMHQRGMKIILDVTPNHTGDRHVWFLAAQADKNAETYEFFTFETHPHDYHSWLNVKSLPKLNYKSEKLREWMYGDEDSVLRHWLKEPYNIDGWRLDVLNMTARQGGVQFSHKVGRGMRRAVKETNPEAYLFGEHFFDGTPHLQGEELDATMNYQGFNIPLWHWLSGYYLGQDAEANRPRYYNPTHAFVEQLAQFRASVPWVIARQQFHQLGSHDTTRILNILEHDKDLMKLGVALLLTYPGVPCIYYGDEIGLDGKRDPDNRKTMPWDENQWDKDLLAYHQKWIAFRKTASALIEGGHQDLSTEGDVWAFMRQSATQRLLVVGHRGKSAVHDNHIPVSHGGYANGTRLKEVFTGQEVTVTNGEIILNLPRASALVFEG
ncbi:MAG: maltodextrin glucosidase [bacterium]|nr:maltodextrin glucosidase [bacterium]